MKFTRIVYGIAAAYGLLVLPPLYFLVDRIGREAPPPIAHPEFFYGFLGLAILWQIIFVLIAKDPVRYRPFMPLAILEKFVYSIPVIILYSQGRLHPNILKSAMGDPILGILFIAAYFQSGRAAHAIAANNRTQ
jgi:hypothetical protein